MIPKPVYTLLIIEDNPNELRQFETAMEEAQLTPLMMVVLARDETQAMEILKSGRTTTFDLILLDLDLPGQVIIQYIKRNSLLATNHVIILGNGGTIEDAQQEVLLRDNAFIKRPEQYKQLVAFCRAIKDSIETEGNISMAYIMEKCSYA